VGLGKGRPQRGPGAETRWDLGANANFQLRRGGGTCTDVLPLAMPLVITLEPAGIMGSLERPGSHDPQKFMWMGHHHSAFDP